MKGFGNSDNIKVQYMCSCTVDTCKNCAKCGKGFKIGTNEAHNIKIKIRVGGISRIFCFSSYANMAASDKGILLKRKFLIHLIHGSFSISFWSSFQL